jgi:hypothetical protein
MSDPATLVAVKTMRSKRNKQSSKRRYGQVIDKWKKGAMQ